MTPASIKLAFKRLLVVIGPGDRLRIDPMYEVGVAEEDPAVYDHLRWMCKKGIRLVDQGRTEKAFRWLGFVQGSLWGLGDIQIEALKLMNKLED
jgi:hypothetical protein